MIRALVLLCVGGCASALVPSARPLHPAQAIVVLGNRPPTDASGQIRPELRRRVEEAVALFRRGLAPVLLMTGGSDPAGIVEAEVMRRHALALGVPPAAIRIEGHSRDTIENARRSVALLCSGEIAPCIPEVIVVTSPYHLERAGWLFECAGARAQLAPTATPPDPNYARSFAFRERGVRLYYGFIDACARACPTGPDHAGR